jgi:hypothetical protein
MQTLCWTWCQRPGIGNQGHLYCVWILRKVHRASPAQDI